MNNDYIRAQIEQLEMVCGRLEDDIDTFRLEIERLKAACAERGFTPLPVMPEAMIAAYEESVENDPQRHPGESWQTEGYDVELEELRKEFIHNGMMGCMHYSNSLYKNCSGLIFCRECYPQYDEEPWEFPTNWHDIEHYPNICRRPDHVSMGVAWSCRECARRMLIDVHQIILRRYREWKPVGESWQTEDE